MKGESVEEFRTRNIKGKGQLVPSNLYIPGRSEVTATFNNFRLRINLFRHQMIDLNNRRAKVTRESTITTTNKC